MCALRGSVGGARAVIRGWMEDMKTARISCVWWATSILTLNLKAVSPISGAGRAGSSTVKLVSVLKCCLFKQQPGSLASIAPAYNHFTMPSTSTSSLNSSSSDAEISTPPTPRPSAVSWFVISFSHVDSIVDGHYGYRSDVFAVINREETIQCNVNRLNDTSTGALGLPGREDLRRVRAERHRGEDCIGIV